jgi:hypothetical protein
LILGIGAACALAPVRAQAQACCAGGGAYAPARLKLFEQALVGLQLKEVTELGSFDGQSHYIPAPRGVAEQDLEEDVLGGLRLTEHAQIGVVVPFVETHRIVPGLSELGGGLGDVSLNGRYDFIYPGDSQRIPGLALLASLTFPSGRPPEQAHTPLATGATGTGTWQGGLGLSAEQLFGPAVFDLTASVSQSLPRTVEHVTELLGLRMSGLLAGGYVFKHGAAIAGTLSYAGSLDAILNGKTVSDSGLGQLTVGVAGGLPITFEWRLQGAVSYDLPWAGLNHIAGVGGTVTVLRTF